MTKSVSSKLFEKQLLLYGVKRGFRLLDKSSVQIIQFILYSIIMEK